MMKIKLFGEDASVVDETQVDALQAEVAQGEVQTTEDLGEISQVATVIEDAVDGIGELEAQADIAQGAIDEGEGISEPHAQAAQVTVESVCRRLGVTPAQVGIRLNTEDFGGSNSKLSQTKLFVESVTETVKKVWKQVVDFLKNLWTRIKEFFAKFFDNADKAEKSVKAAKERAGKITGTADKKTIDAGRIGEAFHIAGKANAGTVDTILKNHVTVLSGLTALSQGAVKALNALDAGLKKGDGDLTAVGPAMESALKDGAKHLGQVSGLSGEDNGFKVHMGALVGGVDYTMTVSVSKEGTTKVTIDPNESKKAPEQIPTLKPAEMETVLAAALSAAHATQEYKKALPALEAVNKEGLKLAEAALSFADKVADQAENNAAMKSALSDARTTVTSLSNQVNRMCTMMPAWTVKGINLTVSYVDQSIAQYKKKEEK